MKQPSLFERAKDIFDRICDQSPDKLQSSLVEACGSDEALRREVESLLQHDGSAVGIVKAAESGGGAQALAEAVADASQAPSAIGIDVVGEYPTHPRGYPSRIGNYRIIRQLGQGGMGEVFEAEQESPKRLVALKVIRAGQVSLNLIKRFEREAFVLGQLQHPGIAHIYESGMVGINGGRQPYFAMELIRGERINAFANTQAFATHQRLELMARVCDAVQHAHQKGIIHRDLKPANILVVEQDTSTGFRSGTSGTGTTIDVIGQPKVLDFGIARVTDSDLQAATIQTDVGQIVGTLAYMSPEQVEGDSQNLDTRCDVYALGAVLF